MKFLVVNNFYCPYEVGGAEESLRLQVEALVCLGHSVRLVTLAHDGQERTEWISGVEVHYIASAFLSGSPMSKSRRLWARIGWQFGGVIQVRASFRILRILRSEKPDVLYVNNLAGIGRSSILLGRLMRIPVIAALRDYTWLCLRQSKFKDGRICSGTCVECRMGTILRRQVARLIGGVVANSAAVLDAFRQDGVFPDVPKRVVYAGVPLPSKVPATILGSPLRIGVMGQLQRTKGFDAFLVEVSSLGRSGLVDVTIAGSLITEYADELQENWRESWVTFAGRLDRKEFFDRVDVVVIPSLWEEPLSRVTYEAMGARKCVVASCLGGQKEIIQDGVNGFLYTPGDGSLERLIRRLLEESELILRCGAQAAQDARRYAPETAAQGLLSLASELVGKL